MVELPEPGNITAGHGQTEQRRLSPQVVPFSTFDHHESESHPVVAASRTKPASSWTPAVRSSLARGTGFVRRRWRLLVAGGTLAVPVLLAYLFLGAVPLPSPPLS